MAGYCQEVFCEPGTRADSHFLWILRIDEAARGLLTGNWASSVLMTKKRGQIYFKKRGQIYFRKKDKKREEKGGQMEKSGKKGTDLFWTKKGDRFIFAGTFCFLVRK